MPAPAALIRAQRAGDIDWAIERQAELYAEEFGYLPAFGSYVAASFGPFVEHFDAALDCLWVAEAQGQRVGCIAIQHDTGRAGWAKLRWYFVEKDARGSGAGRALMETALAFARRAGYEGVWLLTVDDLAAARRRYERAGFKLAHTDAAPCPWAPWGHEQRWELRLA